MTKQQAPTIADYDYLPQGWGKIVVALTDRGVTWDDACALRDSWKSSRFSGTECLRLIIDHGVLDHGGVEAWQAESGMARP